MEFDGLDRKVQFGGDFGIAAVLEAAHLEDAARLGRHLGKRLPDDFMNLGRKERLRGEIFERGDTEVQFAAGATVRGYADGAGD